MILLFDNGHKLTQKRDRHQSKPKTELVYQDSS